MYIVYIAVVLHPTTHECGGLDLAFIQTALHDELYLSEAPINQIMDI